MTRKGGRRVRPVADVIVVAAGASRRMDGVDKLNATIAGRPLLAWTLAAVAAAAETERIVVVTSAERLAEVAGAPWLPAAVAGVVTGGPRRQDSVEAGLRALVDLDAGDAGADDRPVLIHDGARPLVSPALMTAVVDATLRHGAAIPVVPIAETLKRVAGERVAGTLDHAELRLAQTPQGVTRGLLRRAFAALPANTDRELTDEAALLEACNIPVHVLAGDPMNLKVTVPADLRLAEAALAVSPRTRIGFGSDRHSFGPGAPLRLGGVEIAGAARLHGHSDGDVALHAVANALLGAAGLGDLGGLFPADERTPRGAASRSLLEAVVGRVAEAGWRPNAVDVAIEGARPRLAGHLDAMRGAIAALLGLDATAVGVTASTGNLAGSDGAGRSISATALATLECATGR